jgi:hypothetical protein
MERAPFARKSSPSGRRTISSTLNLLLGIWLFIAGFALAAATPTKWDDAVVGVLIVIFASWRLSKAANATPSWLNFVLGIWLIIASWSLSHTSTAAKWNDFAVGCAVIILAIISASARERTAELSPEQRRVA